MPTFGLVHRLEVGAKRLVDAVQNERFASGVFYASRKVMTGAIIDQAELFPTLSDRAVQDNAADAVQRFVEKDRDGASVAAYRMAV